MLLNLVLPFVLSILSILTHQYECGQVARGNASDHRIVKRVVGGENSRIFDAPFVVQLIRDNFAFCSGTIVAPERILTAAHCVTKGVDAVVYGTHRKYTNYGRQYFKTSPVKCVHAHPGYSGGVTPNDIAVLKLGQPILPDSVSQAIDLDPTYGECGMWTLAYGFGNTKEQNSNTRMQAMETTVQNNCPKFQNDKSNEFIITQIEDKTVCHGDSGGPLVGSNGKLIGVLSGTRLTGCVKGDLNYFVKIANHVEFIQKYLYSGDGQNYNPNQEYNNNNQNQGYNQNPNGDYNNNQNQGYNQNPNQGYNQNPNQGYNQAPNQGYNQYPPNQGYNQNPNQGFNNYPNQNPNGNNWQQMPPPPPEQDPSQQESQRGSPVLCAILRDALANQADNPSKNTEKLRKTYQTKCQY